MPLKIIFREFNEDEEGLRFYVSDTPLDPNALPAPVAETGPSDTLTDESAEHGADAVSHTVPWDELQSAYVRIGAVRHGAESVSQEWFYEAAGDPGGSDDFANAQIGDEIGGGIYAGTHTNGTDTWHVIFAKQAGEASGPEWGNYGTKTGATDEDDGLANQNLVLASFDNGSADAFYHCRDYVDGDGNNDYYLPARNELALVDALVGMSHAEFSTGLSTYRWSSTEYSSLYVWDRRFSDGKELYSNKNYTSRRVRPVRRVPV